MTQAIALQSVPFHGDQIITFEADGRPHVAMRRIVENIGIAWEGQRPKLLQQREKFSCHDIMATGADGKTYSMLCMPVDKLALWLACINSNKVPDPAVRAKIELYQAESAIALHDYWTKGLAVRNDFDGAIDDIGPNARRVLGGIVKGIMHKEMAEALSVLLPQMIANDPRAVATEYRPALAILIERKVPAKRRRAFSQRVSHKLRRYSAETGHPVRLSRESGRYLFHADAISGWLAAEGTSLIAAHMAALSGQGVLKLVRPD